ncbi:MAG: phospholipase D-like domain-containing protein, partial [Elusimicrobia bacterium]|nr:phospholipase D-like domain-containing protein [Elusimicrobiota bacterium]
MQGLKFRAGNRVELLSGSEEAFPAMLSAISFAKKSILLQTYTFAGDSAGRKFAAVLAEKAAQGVKVYVIYDSLGSIKAGRSFFENMIKGGINVAEYHPFAPWRPYWTWFRRNHRKLLVVDNETAFIGGMNISDDDSPASWGGPGWKDTAVKFCGPCVSDAVNLFWESWEKCAPLPSGRELFFSQKSPRGAALAEVVSRSGMTARKSIRQRYKRAISQAQKYIYITNAYFLPSRIIVRKLMKAARRGVRVAV